MPETLSQIRSRFVEQLKTDKKKSALLGGLFLILIGLVLSQFRGSASTPEIAQAAPAPSVPVTSNAPALRPIAQATSAIIQPIGAAPSGTNTVNSTAPGTRTPAPRVSVAGMPRELRRDPFDTDAWGKFLPAVIADSGGDGDKKSANRGSIWNRITASLAEHRRQRRKEIEALRRDLAEMHLQSTLTGPSPLAYISGRLVREGELLRGFSVVRIEDRRVVLRKGGHEHELAMR